jgi:predicted dehydrogenase
VHEVADFVRDVSAGRAPSPSFADGLYVQQVMDAVERSSSASSTWTQIR